MLDQNLGNVWPLWCDDIPYFRHVLRATLSGVHACQAASLQWIKKNAPLQNSKWLLVWAADRRTLDSLIQRGTFWNKKVYCLICHHFTLKLLYYEAPCFYEDIAHEGLKLRLPSNHNFSQVGRGWSWDWEPGFPLWIMAGFNQTPWIAPPPVIISEESINSSVQT